MIKLSTTPTHTGAIQWTPASILIQESIKIPVTYDTSPPPPSASLSRIVWVSTSSTLRLWIVFVTSLERHLWHHNALVFVQFQVQVCLSLSERGTSPWARTNVLWSHRCNPNIMTVTVIVVDQEQDLRNRDNRDVTLMIWILWMLGLVRTSNTNIMT